MTLSTLAASPASSEERERLGAGEEPAASRRLRAAVGEVHWDEVGVRLASGLHESGDGLRRGSELASHACGNRPAERLTNSSAN